MDLPLPFGGDAQTDRRRRRVGASLYSRDVTNSTSDPRSNWRRLGDTALSVLLLVVGIVVDISGLLNVPGATVVSPETGGEFTYTGFGTLVGLLCMAAWLTVFWRRRYPLVVLIAGGVIAAIGVSYLLLLVGAASEARRHPSRTRALAISIAAALALFVLREVFTPWGGALSWFFGNSLDSPDPVWGGVAVVLAVLSFALTAAVVLAAQAKQRATHSNERADLERQRAEDLSDEVVRQAERERIARDMHDALAHRLSVVSLHAGALEGVAPGAAGDIARTVREQTHAALEDMRGLIGDLRSGPGEPTPSTMRAIGPLLSELRAAGVTITTYVLIEEPERASAQFDSGVHRVVQEALTNAMKHAASAPIDVYMRVEPSSGARIRVVNPLRVSDEGPAVPGGGHGTLGMRERVAALGGTAWIGVHGESFIVDVTLPWQERIGGSP